METQDEFATTLRLWYRHPDWQAMLLYPWLQSEETFRLSEVYTRLEMESVMSRQVKQLTHYTELFKNINKEHDEGSRILIQGKPGIGKTTFTHKVALDWADGQLGCFDLVFVVQVRDLEPDQTITNAIVSQMCLPDRNEELVNRYLIQNENKVLLILDGLDEKDLKKYPRITRILCGDDYSKCCVMSTSRPHISPKIKNSMSYIANITGFSQKSAEAYVSHIIPQDEIRKQFFGQLIERNMQGMYKVPIILQALALLFNADQMLPGTYTNTYDELVFYLQKTCEASKGLTAQQIGEAMNLVNELAFIGLVQKGQRLVFRREEITDNNVFRLGILSGNKTVTRFNPTSSVQFPHKTVQEYSTAGHVTKELKAGNRKPWERIKKMYREQFSTEEYPSTPKRHRVHTQHSVVEGQSNEALIVNSATQKLVHAIRNYKDGKEAAIRMMFKVVLNNGFLDDEPDIPTLWRVVKSNSLTQSLTDEELRVSFNFVLELLSLVDSEQKARKKIRLYKLVHSKDYTARHFVLALQMISRWMNSDPMGSMELITSIVKRILSSADMPSFQSVTKQVQWLQDQANSMKILFRFIIGKLKSNPEMADQILREIAEVLISHAFDQNSGEVLSVHFLKQYLTDLMTEAHWSPGDVNSAIFSTDVSGNFESTIPMPAVVHIKNSASVSIRPSIMPTNALKLEELSEIALSIIQIIKNMNNLSIVEIQEIVSSVMKAEECRNFAEVLSTKNSIVSLLLDAIDDTSLCSAILNNLPMSTRRLTVLSIPPSKTYQFPSQVNLQCLYIDSNLSGVALFFTSDFPQLKTLSIMSRFEWDEKDISSLHSAVTKRRMPSLQHLCIRFGSLANYGKYILEIIQQATVQTVDLMDTSLTKEDGQILLAAIKGGTLTNIQLLNLLQNPGINELVPEVVSVSTRFAIGI